MKEKNYEKNVHFDSIEEIIGDSSNRYFGDGYKKVEYNIQSMNISQSKVKALFNIYYPSNWSIKKSIPTIPHLSTLDSVIISLKMITEFLKYKFKYSVSLSYFFVEFLEVKAGNYLNENLNNINATLEFDEDKFLFCGKISEFSVNTKLSHLSLHEKLTDSNNDYYYNGFKNKTSFVNNIDLDIVNNKIKAEINNNFSGKYYGIESGYLKNKRLFCLLEQIIVTGQLTELFHSLLDDISRDSSNTLIMRRFVLKRTLNTNDKLKNDILLEIKKSKIIQIRENMMRVSNMISKYGNSTINYSVAQKIECNY